MEAMAAASSVQGPSDKPSGKFWMVDLKGEDGEFLGRLFISGSDEMVPFMRAWFRERMTDTDCLMYTPGEEAGYYSRVRDDDTEARRRGYMLTNGRLSTALEVGVEEGRAAFHGPGWLPPAMAALFDKKRNEMHQIWYCNSQ